MADMTSTEALAHAPASSDKTSLQSAFDTLYTAVTTAGTNGTLSANSAVQLKSELTDWLERLGSNLGETP